jgi:uncharacterized protein (DUF2147 family)
MMTKKMILGAMLATAVAATAVPAAIADQAVGTWRLSDGRVTVRISPCGANLCGHVVGLSQPLNREGKPKVDRENPNPALRSRPVMGLQVLFNLRGNGNGSWTGTIYNADDGGTYSARLKLRDARQIQLKACLGPFCKNRTFVRVN